MNEHLEPLAPENPFCSRRVRPGALPYLFPANVSAAGLVDRLRQNAWWGQIVGPHGSGKSALLAALMPAIELAGQRTLLIELHDGQRRLPLEFWRSPERNASTVLILDGYEQLGLWNRFRLKRFCRRGNLGLLVTAHAPIGLPDLFYTATNLQLARQIVERLQHKHAVHITPEDVAPRYLHHGGNMRETLFDLYDLYQQRQRLT